MPERVAVLTERRASNHYPDLLLGFGPNWHLLPKCLLDCAAEIGRNPFGLGRFGKEIPQ